ncbi:hypothetical protein GCK72_018631 [Caenorhabditis remanei]|uniref:PH-15 domain-containing protein n=1 Tax=Caenorhabditis remanei TaxID=31234 RepID=A0A6A5GAA7_CAERE|nr:hypothetical protein GCK72_018631 [Caenorhabditis remanei]KAF1752077.1 hypothetical protein GCK72_018631 [Caenorhabditis remanei]
MGSYSFLPILSFRKPLIGQILSLNGLRLCNVTRENSDVITVKLITEDRTKYTFKMKGKDGGLWVAAIMNCSQVALNHDTHSAYNDGISSNIAKDLQDKTDNSAFTGSGEGYKLPPLEESESEKKKQKKEEEGGNNNNQGVKQSDNGVQKSGDKKTQSDKNLKPVPSKTKTKNSTTTTESGKDKKDKTLDAPAKQDDPVVPVQRAHSDTDNNLDAQLKKTQTETPDTSGKGNGDTPNKKTVTPISTTPGAALTPTVAGIEGNDEKKKTLTNSDENDPPEKKN